MSFGINTCIIYTARSVFVILSDVYRETKFECIHTKTFSFISSKYVTDDNLQRHTHVYVFRWTNGKLKKNRKPERVRFVLRIGNYYCVYLIRTLLRIRNYKFVPLLCIYFYIKRAFRNGTKTFKTSRLMYSINT